MPNDRWFCSDDTVRVRLSRVCAQPTAPPGPASAHQLGELDQLAEIMIGRLTPDQAALKAEIQAEVRRRWPDRALPGERPPPPAG